MMQFIETIKPKVSVVCYQEACSGKSLCPERIVLLTGDDITIYSFAWKDTKHAEIHISSMPDKTKEVIRSLFRESQNGLLMKSKNEDSHLINDFKTVVTNEEIGTFRKITLFRCNFETYDFAFPMPDKTKMVEISFEAYDIEH